LLLAFEGTRVGERGDAGSFQRFHRSILRRCIAGTVIPATKPPDAARSGRKNANRPRKSPSPSCMRPALEFNRRAARSSCPPIFRS
jgi:hypothetical protein